MPGISLRDYIREIEKQIDAGRTEEATAHSRYILEIYPKYVEAYRLLGKSFLESQRYGDASDIFQRVLSSIPDDFVSHVGMSIIREDEGNLDEAIWHMERAFDVQPSNGAIQEELRRLYEKRDKAPTPRVRLTRGALARMYFKGELYAQAIAEVRAALADTTDRLDLQTLLAEIYYQSGQRAEAVEIAGQVLQHLPFCLVANRVIADALIASKREEEAQTYLQNLIQLDPYTAYISAAAPTADRVPDQAIKLDKFDYKPGVTTTGRADQPTWAASLGVDINNMTPNQEKALPEWLSTETPGPESERLESGPLPTDRPVLAAKTSSPDEGPPVIPATPAGPDEIPDWMKEMGWEPATEASREAEAGFHFEEELGNEVVENELAPAEIPDWLQAIAPGELEAPTGEVPVPAPEQQEDVSPWLEKLFAENVPDEGNVSVFETDSSLVDRLSAESEPAAQSGPGEIPDWLPAATPTAPEEDSLDWLRGEEPTIEEPAPQPAIDLPDWLMGNIEPAEETAEFAAGHEAEETAAEEEFPVWAGASEQTAEQPVSEPGEALPDWLTSLAETPEAAAVEAAAPESGSQFPEWLSGEPSAEEVEVRPDEGLPDWLKAGAAATGMAAAGLAAGLAAASHSDEEPAQEEAAPVEELPEWTAGRTETFDIEAAKAAEVPEWLRDAQAAEEPEAALAEERPEWLSGETEVFDLGAAPAAAAAAFTAEVPEWLRDEQAAEEPGAAPVEALPAVEEQPEATTAEPVPLGELPDWLQEARDFSVDETGQPAGELPEWLQEPTEGQPEWLSQENPPVEGTTPVTPETELPEWLQNAEIPPHPLQEKPAEGLPEWLMEATNAPHEVPAAEQPVEEEPAAQPVETQTEWLQAESSQVQELPPAEIEEDLEDDFAWLDALLTPVMKQPEPAKAVEFVQEEPAPQPQEQFVPPEVEAEPAPPPSVPEPARPEPPAPPTPPAPATMPLDEDAAFAWLEALAVKQGASEALLLKPEDRVDKPPEWVQQAIDEQAEEQVTTAPPVYETIQAPEMGPPEVPVEGTLAPTSEEQPAAEAEKPADQIPPETKSPKNMLLDTEEALAWMESLAVGQEPREAPQLVEAPEETAGQAGTEELGLPAADRQVVQDVAPEPAPAELAPAQSELTETEPSETPSHSRPTEPTRPGTMEPPAWVKEPPQAAPEESKSKRKRTSTGGLPPLPDWLSGVASDSGESMEWTPPPVTKRKYDLNRASLGDLERLPGVGYIMAQRIVLYREEHGDFKSVDELLDIPEFNPLTLDDIRDNLFVLPKTGRTEKTPPPKPAPAPVVLPVAEGLSEGLISARNFLGQGNIEKALNEYALLIASNQSLPTVIQDLKEAGEKHSREFMLWQHLGDAYLRLNQVNEAIQAYARAEQTLR